MNILNHLREKSLQKKLQCPACGSRKVYAYDHEQLELSPDLVLDTELYVKLKCHECAYFFTKIFKLS